MFLNDSLKNSSIGFTFSLFFFIFGLMLAYILYQKQQKRKYSFLNEFPYELYQGVPQRSLSYFYVIEMIKALGFIWFGFTGFVDNKNYYGIILITSWTLTALLMMALTFVKLRAMKGHIAIVSTLIPLTLVNAVFLGIYFYKTYTLDVPLALTIIVFIVAALVLALSVNPLLKNGLIWIRLNNKMVQLLS